MPVINYPMFDVVFDQEKVTEMYKQQVAYAVEISSLPDGTCFATDDGRIGIKTQTCLDCLKDKLTHFVFLLNGEESTTDADSAVIPILICTFSVNVVRLAGQSTDAEVTTNARN